MGLRPRRVVLAADINLGPRPLPRPQDATVRDEIVRLASKAPAPNRRLQRNSFAVKDQPPVGRAERDRHFLAAFRGSAPTLHVGKEIGVRPMVRSLASAAP